MQALWGPWWDQKTVNSVNLISSSWSSSWSYIIPLLLHPCLSMCWPWVQILNAAHWYPQISLVGPIWRCFAQRTISFWRILGSLPAISKIWPHHYKGQISKLSKLNDITYQNVCEKGTKPTKKDLTQSGLPVKRKFQKTTRKYHFLGKWYIREVFLLFS